MVASIGLKVRDCWEYELQWSNDCLDLFLSLKLGGKHINECMQLYISLY